MFDAMRAVVRQIPLGKVATYGFVAELAGYPRGSRQVAWALRQFDAGLPWHRVIGKEGSQFGKVLLRGANGVEQVMRLEAEGVRLLGTRVRLDQFGWDGNPSPPAGRKRAASGNRRSPGR